MDLYYKGRERLRWEDCVKRDVKKAGDRGGWKRLAGDTVAKRKRDRDKTIQKLLYMTFDNTESNSHNS